MSKSKTTTQLEGAIYRSTRKNGTFRCFEVTIPIGGSERVDFMTITTKGEVRCYEVKSSKQDFYSKYKHSFFGHYNYFVMKEELYEQVKDDIPDGIGVHNGSWVIKRPKKQRLKFKINTILWSLVRSLCRDADKYNKIATEDIFVEQKKEINRLKNSLKREKERNGEDSRMFMAFLRDKGLKKEFNKYNPD